MDHDPKLKPRGATKRTAEDDLPCAESNRKLRSKRQTAKDEAIEERAFTHRRNVVQDTQEVSNEDDIKRTSTVDSTIIYPEYLSILPRFHCSAGSHINGVEQLRHTPCKDCAKIDLDTLLSRPHKTVAGQAVKKKLRPARDLKTTPCALCQLIYSSLGPVSKRHYGSMSLRTFSSGRAFDKTWSSINTNMMQFNYANRYIVSQPQGIDGPIRIVKSLIEEYEIFKGWVNLCRTYHTKVCAVDKSQHVPFQKLIDCETRTIVPASSHPYVALSYVWGVDSEVTPFSERLPFHLPNTIEDSISVTLKLGYRYLWIDRYCINQQSEEEKNTQVPAMDIIYQHAELTIIAAAGSDPSYGLPGVGKRRREDTYRTMCSKVGKHFLITTESNYPLLSILKSKWKTRAWTYQEAVLSRRRLVFANEEVYFECYGMHCSESHNFPLLDMHREDMQGFKSNFCQGHEVGMFPKGVGTSSLALTHRISEYTKLNLTYPGDILKGISGILNSFQRGRFGIRHYAGIPIVPRGPRKSEFEGIEWTPTMGFLLFLLWNIKNPSERRIGGDGTEFPSWSWTGWYGPVDWEIASSMLPDFDGDPDIQIKVELLNGQTLTLEDYHELDTKGLLKSQPSPFLRISAWTVHIYHSRAEPQSRYYHCRTDMEEGGYIEWSFHSISEPWLQRNQVLTGIMLGHGYGVTTTGALTLLILSGEGDKMQRIGFDILYSFTTHTKEGTNEYTKIDHFNSVLPKLVKSWQEIRLG